MDLIDYDNICIFIPEACGGTPRRLKSGNENMISKKMWLIITGLQAKDRVEGLNTAELYCLSAASWASLISALLHKAVMSLLL